MQPMIPFGAPAAALWLRRKLPETITDEQIVKVVTLACDRLTHPETPADHTLSQYVELFMAGYELNVTVIGEDPTF